MIPFREWGPRNSSHNGRKSKGITTRTFRRLAPSQSDQPSQTAPPIPRRSRFVQRTRAPEEATKALRNARKGEGRSTVGATVSFGGFVFTHGHFGFQKQRAAPVCMILMIFLEARPRAGAIKATPATDLMVFPAVPDHSRPQVRLALSCRPRLGFGSRGLVVRSLRHLPWGSRRQAMKFRRSAAGKSRCRTPLPSRGPELSPEWQAF